MQFKLQSLKRSHGQGGARVSMWMREVPSPLKVVHMRHPSRGPTSAWYRVYFRKRHFGRCVPITGGQLQDTPVLPPHGQTVGRGNSCQRQRLIIIKCSGTYMEGLM